MQPATSIARHSRVYSSTTVRHLSCWPLAQASNTKSLAQTCLNSGGRHRSGPASPARATSSSSRDTGTPIQPLPDGAFLVSGQTSIVDLNRRFEPNRNEAEYATIAGFLLDRLGRIGQMGDVVATERSRFAIVTLDGHRIDRIRFSETGEAPPSPS